MARWLTYTSYSLYFDGADMTADEIEFLLAVASYQKRFHRRYPIDAIRDSLATPPLRKAG